MLSEVTRYSFYLNEIKEMPFSNICSLSFFFLALSTTTTSPSSHCQASTTCPSYGHCEYWEASCPLHGIATNAAQSGIYILYLHLVINLNSFFEDLLLDWSPFPGSVVTPYQLSERWSVCAADIVLVEHVEMAVLHRCLCCTVGHKPQLI